MISTGFLALRHFGLAAIILCVLMYVFMITINTSLAASSVQFGISSIEGADWRAEGLAINMQFVNEKYADISMQVDRLEYSGLSGEIKNASIRCPAAILLRDRLQCDEASLEFANPVLGKQHLAVTFSYNKLQQAEFSLRNFAIAEGNASAKGRWQPEQWNIQLTASELAAERLLKLIDDSVLKTGANVAGLLSIEGSIESTEDQPAKMVFEADTHQLSYSNEDGSQAGENLNAHLTAEASKVSDHWVYQIGVNLSNGQIYSNPVFIDTQSDAGLRLSSKGFWYPRTYNLQIDSAEIVHLNALQATFQGTINLADKITIQNGVVTIVRAQFPEFYSIYVQPFLIGTMLDDMSTEGQFSGRIKFVDDALSQINLAMKKISLIDKRNLFDLLEINSQINWHSGDVPLQSTVSIAKAHLYQIPLGPVYAMIESQCLAAHIIKPVSIPVLDGELTISKFKLDDIGLESLNWSFDAALAPLSLERFTDTVGWPPMSGKISGEIPNVNFTRAGNSLQVDGALLIRAFDGSFVINHLNTQDLFGVAPEFNADISIHDIDLKELTRTFSFGRMEGKMAGYINNLQLVNWQPVRFDASLQTPPDSKARRRISQSAVDNLTQLGNGVSGVLSTSFLRFFEDFSYSKLGLSCALRNDVCDMQGIEDTKDGYFIVKGAGIPRIDIIGHTHQVSWTELIDRLKNINTEEGPVIQ